MTELKVVITIDTATRGEVLPGLLATTEGQSQHAQMKIWKIILLWTTVVVSCINNMNIDTQNPATASLAQQYLFSIYISTSWLPGQCQLLVAWQLYEK